MARAWPALMLALLPAAATLAQVAEQDRAGADAKSVIYECSSHLNARPTGLPELEKECPGLQSALAQSRIRPLIIDSSRARLDRQSLLQLRRLLEAPTVRAPDVSVLRSILHGLKVTPPAPRPWWERLWDWLVDHFTPRQNTSNSWLTDLLRSAMQVQWLWTAIIWATLIALPVTIAIVVWREVKALGRRSTDERGIQADPFAIGPAASRLALLRATPMAQRPAMLFAMLIGQLVAARRLPADRSLTHREVARKAVLDDIGQRRLIESLARVSERQLYAQAPGTPEGLADLLSQGEDLYITGWARPADAAK